MFICGKSILKVVKVHNILGNFKDNFPYLTSMDYHIKLSSITGVKGKLKTKFLNYRKCETSFGVIKNYKGINPLDRSKFILKWRGAIK